MAYQSYFEIAGEFPSVDQCLGLFAAEPVSVTFVVRLDDGSTMQIEFMYANDGDEDHFTITKNKGVQRFELQAQARSDRGAQGASVEMIAKFVPETRAGSLEVRYTAYSRYLFAAS